VAAAGDISGQPRGGGEKRSTWINFTSLINVVKFEFSQVAADLRNARAAAMSA
jgi:hypothetical protein